MKISIILGHPTPGSFNHAIATTARALIEAAGHTVWFHDLHAEHFNPVPGANEYVKGSSPPPELARHCEELLQADGFIIVHPNYWSQPPAILKGWVDRVIRQGLAYRFVPDGKGGGKPQGLLNARHALVIVTANTPEAVEIGHLGDPLESLWKKAIFGLCGVPCERLTFTPVIASTAEQRQRWLEAVSARVKILFT
jgi:NAD(P)H dehydrogenase (quinone)